MLLFLGMLPAVLLILYIYKLDKIEKEPVSLLVKLFIFGGLTTIAASAWELVGCNILELFVDDPASLIYMFIENFLIVGVAEETVKYLALRKVTWYHPDFNYRFDAVIYSVVVSLGFAAFENVLYIMQYGTGVILIRAITAIPMHCITGIFMGYFYGEAKEAEEVHNWNRMDTLNLSSVVIPVLLHGFYDFAASSDSVFLSLLFLAYIVVLDIVAFLCIRRFSAEDVAL